jgi:spore maturation protein CgeB
MRLAYFAHSLASCWNHGNAHFLRGVLRELVHIGHQVQAFEPAGGWSLANLLQDHGADGLEAYRVAYPELTSQTYGAQTDVEGLVADSDVVIVHEWNEPWLIAALGKLRRSGGHFVLLFHDTHHRAVSDPAGIRGLELDAYDGVLAFGEALAEVYRRWGWGDRVYVWHEAADTRLFHPPAAPEERRGLVWIGNWGDEERTQEIVDFLLRPAQGAGLALDVHGVRYPPAALRTLLDHGARYRGWLPNARVPPAFARHLATAHIPRRFYAEALPGIPTIRIFEALACGIPLVSAPWDDAEGLFRAGVDFLLARNPAEMQRHFMSLKEDGNLRRRVSENGLARIRERHTCRHRVIELFAIIDRLGSGYGMGAAA